MTPLMSQGNRPLQMKFENQLNALIYFHLEEHTSGRHLLQVLKEDSFARNVIAPPNGIEKSAFFEAIDSSGLEQLIYLFEELQTKATGILPNACAKFGELVAIDASLSMYWADYRDGSKKAKIHLGFDINRSITRKIFLTAEAITGTNAT